MSAEHQSLPDDVDALKALVLASRAEVEHLKLIIAKLKRLQFGRHSEKLTARSSNWSCGSKNCKSQPPGAIHKR
jgi:hypothetical protein